MFIYYDTVLHGIVYLTILSILSYVVICRYACKVELNQGSIKVKYLFPYSHTKTIAFDQSNVIRYELGYYNYFNSEHSFSTIQIIHPHDEIYFYKNASKDSLFEKININTRFKDFKRIRIELEKKVLLIHSYED